MNYLIERLTESSTWRGIILMLTSLGVGISPELAAAIVPAGIGLAGIVGVLTKDKR